MSSGIQAINKANELLSVMAMCRNAFHNDAIGYTCYKLMGSTINRIFVACVVLVEAISPCFSLKPDDCNLATTILVPKISQLHKKLVLGKLWVEFL